MAIYIIDQFSLNTDLPLDVRYVPTGGRFDPDISIYKYPGMQVYDTNEQSIWYCDNNLDWIEFGSAADASINELINIITDISTRVGDNETSITNIYNELSALESSIGRIDTSLNNYGELLQIHESSIGTINIRLGTIDTSIADLYTTQGIQDTSIADLFTSQGIQDTSIAEHDASIKALFDGAVTDDASLNELYLWNESQDSSIDDINTEQGIQDASINDLRSDISDIETDQGIQDVSIADLYTSQGIQDASIKANTDDIDIIDVSIADLYSTQAIQDTSIVNLEASLGLYVAKAGDTMTGNLTISSGGITVQNGDSTFQNLQAADGTFTGDLGVRGNFNVDGSVTFIDSTTLEVSTNFIRLNTGLEGTPPSWLQSGVIIERGDASAYAIIFDETDTTFRVGQVWNPDPSGTYLDTQTVPVATRQDDPDNNGIAVWKSIGDNLGSFVTDTNLTYDGDNLSLTDASLILNAYAGASDLMLVVQPNGVVKAVASADGSIGELYDYIDGSLATRDASITYLYNYDDIQDASIKANTGSITIIDASITAINLYTGIQDTSILLNTGRLDIVDGSITSITNYQSIQDASIKENSDRLDIVDGSITAIDSSITEIYEYLQDVSSSTITGVENVGDGSAGIYASTVDGSVQLRTITGLENVTVAENGNVIEISIDGSLEGTTASNIGTGEGIYADRVDRDLKLKTIEAIDDQKVLITSDNSTLYIDVSIAAIVDASLVGLTDTSISETDLNTHSNLEFDASSGKWVNTDNIWWDNSLGTTTDDLGGIEQGTDLSGMTLKEILFKILYEYQVPTLEVGSDPIGSIYEKGLVSTQFASIDVSWNATNANYPLALLGNVTISKTGSGIIDTEVLGGLPSASKTYTDATGITNWGGVSRTINYNIEVTDDQSSKPQPATIGQESFTFYYRQFWGTVPGNTNANAVDSDLILGLSDSRLVGASDLDAEFSNPGEVFVKYLYAFPDTISAPDNFGLLSQIIDQNEFDLTDSFETQNEDVSIGENSVRYRFYLSKNKVDTSEFGITFKF